MSFRKPFRAVPIQLGTHYHRKMRRERRSSIAGVLVQAAFLGLLLALGSVIAERPARQIWRAATEDRSVAEARERSVHYSGCNAARAAGAAPIYAGEPGYRSEMDGDGDGIACEPHPR